MSNNEKYVGVLLINHLPFSQTSQCSESSCRFGGSVEQFCSLLQTFVSWIMSDMLCHA